MIFGLFEKKGEKKGKEIPVGEVVHYFGKIKVVVIKIKKNSIAVGDSIRIKGHTTDVKQEVASMQIDYETVEKAAKGKEVAIKVSKKVRRKDKVFVVQGE